MNNIKLSPRLFAVASNVPKCNLLADIGTDHAYIPMYAVKNGIAKKAIASDVVDGPVAIAKDNVKNNGLQQDIDVVKAYGLKSANGANVAVIAGMGGKLICDILEQDIDIAHSVDTLVLQPMTCNFELRKFLHQNGFEIITECLAKEDEKIYNIMVVKSGEQKFDDEFYYYIGKSLYDNKDPLLLDYIKAKANVIKKRIDGMKKSDNERIINERAELEVLYNRFMKEMSRLANS